MIAICFLYKYAGVKLLILLLILRRSRDGYACRFEKTLLVRFQIVAKSLLIHIQIFRAGAKVKRHAYASRDYLLQIGNWIKS